MFQISIVFSEAVWDPGLAATANFTAALDTNSGVAIWLLLELISCGFRYR